MELYKRIYDNLTTFEWVFENKFRYELHTFTCIACNALFREPVYYYPIEYQLVKPYTNQIGVEYYTKKHGPFFTSFMCRECNISTESIDLDIVELMRTEDSNFIFNLVSTHQLKLDFEME